jgi:hypothetical protein
MWLLPISDAIKAQIPFGKSESLYRYAFIEGHPPMPRISPWFGEHWKFDDNDSFSITGDSILVVIRIWFK